MTPPARRGSCSFLCHLHRAAGEVGDAAAGPPKEDSGREGALLIRPTTFDPLPRLRPRPLPQAGEVTSAKFSQIYNFKTARPPSWGLGAQPSPALQPDSPGGKVNSLTNAVTWSNPVPCGQTGSVRSRQFRPRDESGLIGDVDN